MVDGLQHRLRRGATSATPTDTAARESTPPARPAGVLTVGHADDPAEAAADRAAASALSRLRRMTATPDSRSPLAEPHRHGAERGHDLVQRVTTTVAAPEVGREGGGLSADTTAEIERMRGGGAPLPDPVRRDLEAAFGTPLDRVRVHTGPRAEALNTALSARAFTVGRDIFLGAGGLRPDTAEGAHTLAHEVAHTLQGPGPVGRVVDTPVRRYTQTRGGDKGGTFIGPPEGCHLHIDIGKPHFKFGTMQNTRIDFGSDLNPTRMQRAYDYLLSSFQGTPGFEDCKEWLEEQGCAETPGPDELEELKEMLRSWGGLGESSIGWYDAETGRWTDVPFGSAENLDGTIEEHKADIHAAAAARDAFLEEGGISGIDEDELQSEQERLYEADRRRAQGGRRR